MSTVYITPFWPGSPHMSLISTCIRHRGKPHTQCLWAGCQSYSCWGHPWAAHTSPPPRPPPHPAPLRSPRTDTRWPPRRPQPLTARPGCTSIRSLCHCCLPGAAGDSQNICTATVVINAVQHYKLFYNNKACMCNCI